MRIFLIGFMGAGKTTVGRRLAKILDLEFYDMDSEIENVTGMTITDLFATKGEVEFRKVESELLHKLSSERSNAVVSTGGGTPCFHENMLFMNRHGITVYLELSVGALVNRLSNSKRPRPLIQGLNKGELTSYVADTLSQRSAYYEDAKVIMDGLNVDENILAEQIRDFKGLS